MSTYAEVAYYIRAQMIHKVKVPHSNELIESLEQSDKPEDWDRAEELREENTDAIYDHFYFWAKDNGLRDRDTESDILAYHEVDE